MNEKATAGGKLKHNIPTLVILIVSGAMCYAFPYFRSYYYDTYMEAFGFNDIQMGVLGSAYGSFAILAYFLGGFCADRWPAKNLLALSMLVSGVLGLALLAYPPFWVVFAIHAVWGITTILTFWDALVKALRTIASEDEQGRVFGLFEGGRGATNMIQSALILAAFGLISAKSGGKAGISMIIIIYAVIYILLGVLILLCYKEPEFKRETHAIVNVPQLKKVLKMPTTWLQSAIIFCSYAMCCSYFYVTPYAQEVFGYGRQGDVLLGLSTSGNSENVINAVKVARAAGLRCVGIGGQGGGMLRELSHVYVALPERETYLVQELTLPVYHAWCRMLEAAFWGDGHN